VRQAIRAAILAALVAWAPALAAQSPKVYVMTMGPGEAVWERFGHNAIWIEDPSDGTSVSYNYGLFDFEQENFFRNFAQGRMLYWMGGFPALPYASMYVRQDRSVWVQELALTPAQAAELRRFLEWNAEPAHKHYRYDYYRDNCSTRVRDALDRVLGGAIRARYDTAMTPHDYRWHTRRLTAAAPLTYAGIDLALGHPVDRPISEWEAQFLPLELQRGLRGLSVNAADGRAAPLVAREFALHESTTFADRPAPPRWLPWFLLLGTLIGAAALALGRAAARATKGRTARRTFGALAGGWALLTGVAGLVLAGLWALTDHVAASRNENVLQANLLALPLAFAIIGLVMGRPRAARAARALAVVVAAVSVLGMLLQVLPGLDQANGEMIALFLPAHLGVAAGTLALARGYRV